MNEAPTQRNTISKQMEKNGCLFINHQRKCTFLKSSNYIWSTAKKQTNKQKTQTYKQKYNSGKNTMKWVLFTLLIDVHERFNMPGLTLLSPEPQKGLLARLVPGWYAGGPQDHRRFEDSLGGFIGLRVWSYSGL